METAFPPPFCVPCTRMRLPDGSGPSMAVTMRRFAPSDPNLHYAALQSLAVNAARRFRDGRRAGVKVWQRTADHPISRACDGIPALRFPRLALSPNTVVEYDYATSLPNTRDEKGFDSAPADLSEADPRISMTNFTTRLERAHHQELSVSRHVGKNSVQVGRVQRSRRQHRIDRHRRR